MTRCGGRRRVAAPGHRRPHRLKRFGDSVHRTDAQGGVAGQHAGAPAGARHTGKEAHRRCPSCRDRRARRRAQPVTPPGHRDGAVLLARRRRRGRGRPAVRATSSPSESPVMVEVALGQRGQQQGAVGDGLVAGHPDANRPARSAPSARHGGNGAGAHRLVPELADRRTGSPARPGRLANVGAERRSTTRTSTPRSPSTEWAISRSTMLTPSSAARVVISASTPVRSGTGTRTSARLVGAGYCAARARRAVGRPLEHLEQRRRGRGRPPADAWPRGRR